MTDNEAFLNALNLLRQDLHGTIDHAIDEIARQYAPRNAVADLAEALTSLENGLNQVVALTDYSAKARRGTEIHGKLRRAKKDLDTLDPTSAAVAGIREQLRVLTDRLLKEVFCMDPDMPDAAGNQNS